MLFGKAHEQYEKLKETLVLSGWTKECEFINDGGFTFSCNIEHDKWDKCLAIIKATFDGEVHFCGFFFMSKHDEHKLLKCEVTLEEVIEFLPEKNVEFLLYNIDLFI